MWKNNIVKLTYKIVRLTYRLNRCLNAIGVGNLSFVRHLKQIGKHIINRFVTPDSLFLIRIDGLRMYIHSNTAETKAYLCRPFEPYTTELFQRAIRSGTVVLDIGAQFGYFSLLAAKRVGKHGRVYAFEASPANFKLLKRNIEMNKYNNTIHAIPKAVGDKPGIVTLFVYEGSDSHGMYRHPEAAVKDTVQVECVTIDDFLGAQRVDVIKMDIEGNEPYALEGMKQTILKSDSLILFAELAPEFLRRAGWRPEEYLAQLNALGFDVQLIDERSRCLKPDIEGFLSEDDPSRYANLYCTRRKGLRKA